MRGDDLDLELNVNALEIDNGMGNNDNFRDNYAGAAKRDLIAETLRIRNI